MAAANTSPVGVLLADIVAQKLEQKAKEATERKGENDQRFVRENGLRGERQINRCHSKAAYDAKGKRPSQLQHTRCGRRLRELQHTGCATQRWLTTQREAAKPASDTKCARGSSLELEAPEAA